MFQNKLVVTLKIQNVIRCIMILRRKRSIKGSITLYLADSLFYMLKLPN